jgi:hypothetical protein
LAEKSIYITPIIISKPGQKGGDVKFSRAKNDIDKILTECGEPEKIDDSPHSAPSKRLENL